MVRSVRTAMGLMAVLAVGSCQDLLVDPAPAASTALSLSVASIPLVEAGAQGPAAAFDAADRVRIRLLRGTNVVAELDRAFAPEGEETRIQLEVELEGTAETLQLELTLSWQGQPLFTAQQSVSLELERTTTAEVSLNPVGAGVQVQEEAVILDALGAEAQLAGAVLFATGDVIPGLGLTWTSGAPAMVQVSTDGRVTALAAGEAEVTGSYQEFSGSVTVQVEQITASVVVEPATAQVVVEETIQLQAHLFDGNGNPIPQEERDITWTSSDPGVATVDAQGLVEGISNGQATITATAEEVSGQAEVSVLDEPPVVEGNLQIRSSEDLAEFAANGWEVVDGDLIIGEEAEGDFLLAGQGSPLVDLSGLETLRRVTGNLEIRNNQALQDISALSGLTEVQGLLEIVDNAVLIAVPSFPGLATLGGLRVVGNTQLQEVGAAPLVGETGSLVIASNPSLSAIDDPLPALTSVSGAVLLTFGDGVVEILGFEALETVGGTLQIGILPELTTLSSFPSLRSVGNVLALVALGRIQELEFGPSLESVPAISVRQNGSLVELSGFGNVQSVPGNVGIVGHSVLNSLPALAGLESVGGRLELRANEAMTSLDDFSSLRTISGHIWIRDNPALQNLDGLSGVTSRIQDLWINNNGVLESIAGLENLGLGTGRPGVPAVQGDFTVTNNPILPESDAQDLAALLGVGGQISISGNLSAEPMVDGLASLHPAAIRESSPGRLERRHAPTPPQDSLMAFSSSDFRSSSISLIPWASRACSRTLSMSSSTVRPREMWGQPAMNSPQWISFISTSS